LSGRERFSLDRRVSSLFIWDVNEILLAFIGRPYIARNVRIPSVDMNENTLLLEKIRDNAENIMMNAII
jgi:hypothetical protein